MKKKTIIIFLIILTLFSNITICNARANSDLWKTGKNWIETGKNAQNQFASPSNKPKWTKFNDLAGILWGAGVFIIAIAGGVLGIKYMFASLEEKAAMKEGLWPFVIGSTIILGALTIWKLSVDLLAGI